MMDRSTIRHDPGTAAVPLAHAVGYHRRAEQFRADRAATSIVFNVAAVALENYLIALCAAHGLEPASHTFTDLVGDVECLVDVEPDLGLAIRSLDLIFDICSLDDYHHPEPGPLDADRTLWMCDGVAELLRAAPDEREEEVA